MDSTDRERGLLLFRPCARLMAASSFQRGLLPAVTRQLRESKRTGHQFIFRLKTMMNQLGN
jgi:hypothetical protein